MLTSDLLLDTISLNVAFTLLQMCKTDNMKLLYLKSCSLILLTTGVIKVISSFANSKILLEVDPVIGVNFQTLFFITGTFEILISSICFREIKSVAASFLILWLSTCFLIYRLGLYWINWKKPCNCLGGFVDWIGVSPVLADNLMFLLLLYMLFGNFILIYKNQILQRIEM